MSHTLYIAQQGKCFYCNQIMAPISVRTERKAGWTADHFIPKAYLRPRKLVLKFNKVLAHAICNERKGDRFPTQLEILKFKKLYEDILK